LDSLLAARRFILCEDEAPLGAEMEVSGNMAAKKKAKKAVKKGGKKK
jgi:hypothetical protein